MKTQAQSKEPMVSILVVTYNHRNFIGQALQSILDQKVSFDFEINVVEDCSSDGTQDILREYRSKYPDKINLFLNERNVGSAGPYLHTQKVFYKGFGTLRGKYIAILEGDDYWACESKLQEQVDFLEKNSGFVGCAHNTMRVYEDGSRPPERFMYWPNMPEVREPEDFFAMTTFFHSNTILYRNVFKGRTPIQFKSRYSCDIFITMAHVEHGAIRYFDKDWTVYRVHEGGCYSGMSAVDGRIFNIDGIRRYNEWLGYRHLLLFSQSIHCLCRELLVDERLGLVGNMGVARRLKLKYFMWTYGAIFIAMRYPTMIFRFLRNLPLIIAVFFRWVRTKHPSGSILRAFAKHIVRPSSYLSLGIRLSGFSHEYLAIVRRRHDH